ncbi:MAG: lipopolysaccharide biosynthesis protein [Candidatus Cryptobacteroides sp.]
MSNPLKQLAGETAVYGLSTILARIINFLFVPFYTRLLTTSSYGVVTEFMAYIAVLQVVLVLGLETGCFNFANREGVSPVKVYSNALAAVFGTSFSFLALLVLFRTKIAGALGYAGFENCIIYIGGILALDCTTAILFAKLRQEHRAFKFAIFKTVKILTETAANMVLFFWYPSHSGGFADSLISPTPDFTYVIFAIFISSLVCGLLFIPDLLRFSFKFDARLLKQMLAYSIPLMIAALPGIVNDFLDRILFRYFDTDPEAWRSSLGIFQAAVKLSVIMNLFIQMFRFAAEPFFFQRAREKGSKQLYAIVMEYFTAFCGLILIGVFLYLDIFALILGKDFRSGMGVVPIMLLSYMLLGMLFNVSMWYKLSGKTNMAIWITMAGLVVTVAVNVVFMPRFSFWAAAFGHLASYLVMFIISAVLGNKFYPIPYSWKRILTLMLGAGLVCVLAIFLDNALFQGVAPGSASAGKVILKLAAHSVLLIGYVAVSALVLKGRYNLAVSSKN